MENPFHDLNSVQAINYDIINAKKKSKQHQHWSKYTNFETEEEGNKIAPQCETSGH